MKILFFPLGDKTLGSTRIHVYEKVNYLKKKGIDADTLVKKDKIGILGHKDRYLLFPFVFWKYDAIFFQKKLDFVDYLLMKFCKFFGKKVIFHIDDFFPEERDKMIRAIKVADMVLVVSHFLEDFAFNFNNKVYIVPTFADASRFKIKEHVKKDSIVIGWLGHSLFENLDIVIKPLENLSKRYTIVFKVIGDIDEQTKSFLKSKFRVDSTGWVDPSKVPDELLDFDIGLMPCPDNPLHQAAVPGKLLEYMATGLPTVSSPVGEILYIIKDGVNGFLAKNEEEWEKKLEMLIKDVNLRKRIGKEARKTIVDDYSIEVNDKMVELIKNWDKYGK